MSLNQLLKKLHRTTTSGFYLPEIDGLRALAIFLVIAAHLDHFGEKAGALPAATTKWSMLFEHAIPKGGLGVNIFFALSGFIICLPFLAHYLRGGKPVSKPNFYWRRITRLEPPYVISSLVLAFMQVAINKRPLVEIVKRLLASLVYQHNLIYGSNSMVNPVAWSLEVEFQFYMVAPLLLGLFAIGNRWARRGVILVGVGMLMAIRPDGWRWAHSVVGLFEYFAVGIVVADVYLTEWDAKLPRSWSWDLAAAIGWASFCFASWPEPSGMVDAWRVASLLLALLGTLGGVCLNSVFRNQWTATFGGMCYTIYLYHSVMLEGISRAMHTFTIKFGFFTAYSILLSVNIVILAITCSVLFLVLEKPFMQKNWPATFSQKFRELFKKGQPAIDPSFGS